MGLFGWHKCKTEGCDATLFIPLFDEAYNGQPDGAMWKKYQEEKKTWLIDEETWQDLCPKHKPSTHENEPERSSSPETKTPDVSPSERSPEKN